MQQLIVLLISMACCGGAYAQDERSMTSSGDYAMDLGQVYGAIRSAKFMDEICSESFPDQREFNAEALAQWRARHLPFIQEIEKHFSVLAWKESGGDPQKHVKFLADTEKAFDGYRAALKSQMTAEGPDTFADQCKLYPTYLATDRMDLERYYAEQVVVIRKGASR